MIAIVEVGLCFERPPTEQKIRRVIVSAETEAEAHHIAALLALIPEKFKIEPTMPVSTRIIELLAL